MTTRRKVLTPLLTLVVLLSLVAPAQDGHAGTFSYARGFGGYATDRASRVTVDGSGNIYITGSFTGLVDFDPGSGTANLTGGGGTDAFVVKLNPSDNFVWARRFGGAWDDVGTEVGFDGAGNVYLTGYFADVADLDPGTSTLFVTSAGAQDIFLVKLNPSGNLVWANRFGSTSHDKGNGLAVDTAGNVYLTGEYSSTVDFDPGTGTVNLTSNGGNDIFVARFDTNGGLTWAKGFGSISSDRGNSVAVDAAGNAHATGFFSATADFDPGYGTSNLTAVGLFDVFALKLETNGNLTWARAFGSTAIDDGLDLALDGSGNVYLTGEFSGTVDFDPGSGTFVLTATIYDDVFAMKLNSSGGLVWARQFAGAGSATGFGITLDGAGNVYLTGSFDGTVDFNSGTATLNTTSAGQDDVFAVKLDAHGDLVWARKIGGSGEDNGGGVAVDGSGSVYLAGGFANVVDFNPSTGTSNLSAVGGTDAFALKLVQVAPPINTIPTFQGTTVNTPRTFSSTTGNRITIIDSDAGSSPVRVTMSVTLGTVTLDGVAGLTFTQGDGSADTTMTFSGTLPAINAALDAMVFTPSPNQTGVALLEITSADLVGPTGGQVDRDVLRITIS